MRYFENLNERQKEAVTCTEGPLIVLAGAGSGKTKMLTSRVSYLIDGLGVPAHQVLAVTFTNKAAAEMKERISRLLQIQFSENPWSSGPWLGTPEIGTFHSVCLRILRREAQCTPFTGAFVIYDDSDQLSLLKRVLQKLEMDEKQFSPKAIQAAINRLKCDAIEPCDFTPESHDFFGRQVKRVYEQYQKDLFASNAIDFGEILCMTYRIFRDFPEIRAKYQKRFRYIHVDEYQDTNRAQYLLLSMLASQLNQGHQNICVVGDEDQSIYKWRGADIRNILDFEQDYPGAKIVKLEQNYRSTSRIIRAAAQLIRNNRQRREKTLFTENSEGEKLIRSHLADERAEADFVVSEVKRRCESEARSYSDFSIFYRTNAQSRQFEDVLRRVKIPYQIVGGLRFYDRKEIKDILAYFKLILNRSDSVSLKRVINVPARGIGKTTIDKLESLQSSPGESDQTLWSVLRSSCDEGSSQFSSGTVKKIAGFASTVERLSSEQPKLLLSELYHLVLDQTGYVRELRAEGTEEALGRIENLEEFDSLLQEFEEDLLEGISEEQRVERLPDLLRIFIEQSTLASEADQKTEGDSVKLMTLHASKGLEFPVVFMVGMEDGLFPSVKSWDDSTEEDLEEERRLCYVGITRAREILYLTHVSMRRIWGEISYQQPACFFSEISDESIDFRDLAYGKSASQYRTGSSRWGDRQIHVEYEPEYSPQGGLVGSRLGHPEYGEGRIISVEGASESQKVLVEFRGGDRRKFLWRYVQSFLKS